MAASSNSCCSGSCAWIDCKKRSTRSGITTAIDGNLWIGNSTEVKRFHHISQSFGFYHSETGLRDNDKLNHIPRIAVSKENQLFFATGNGVNHAGFYYKKGEESSENHINLILLTEKKTNYPHSILSII